MPWMESTTMDAKVAFILDWKSGKCLVSDLCAQYGISRKTGYKCINRSMDGDLDGLFERSHAPCESPHRTHAGMGSTMTGPTRYSMGWCQQIPVNGLSLNIRIYVRCAMSVPMEAFGGSIAGSM